MTCQFLTLFLIAVLMVAMTLLIPAIRYFKNYCRRLAELEGRVSELQSVSTDDGGLTRFERENLSKLMARYYRKFDDTELTALGDKVRGWLVISYGGAILFLLLSVIIWTKACN